MNWIQKSADILGKFWCELADLCGLVDCVRIAFSLFGRTQEQKSAQWKASILSIDDDHKYCMSLPFPIYFIKQTLKIDADGELVSREEIGCKARPIEDVLSGACELGSETPNVFVLKPAGAYPASFRLTSSVIDPKVTMIHGMDYEVDDVNYIFYTDPSKLGLTEISLADNTTDNTVYYKMFGWPCHVAANSELANAVADPSLSEYADTVWDMHVNGATVYNSKSLLCSATGAVMATNSGLVSSVWYEQGLPCVSVDNVLYMGKRGQTCNFAPGSLVVDGDVLFGSVYEWHGGDIPDASKLHGVMVRTDVGELYAANAELPVVAHEYNGKTYQMLPLSLPPSADADSDMLVKYYDRCAELFDSGATRFSALVAGATVNPCAFILKTLRFGRSAVFMLTPMGLNQLLPAIQCIRKNTTAGGMVSIYIKADCDTAGIALSGFLSDAGNMAVSEDATITIQDALVDVGVHK